MKPSKSRLGVIDLSEELPVLIDAVQDYAIFGLSPTGHIGSWNKGAARIMGYTADEVMGEHFSIFYGPEDLEAAKPERELEVARTAGRVEDEGWRIRKDGTKFWANTVITSLRQDDGTVRGFLKVTRDLTQKREADERLRQSEENFRLLVAAVKDYAIFLLDPQGNVATWNAGAQAIKGYKPEEIIGKHFSTFYLEEEKRWKPKMELEIAVKEGRFEEEGQRVRKDGSIFWASVVITAVRDEQGRLRGFTKVTRDITDRIRAAQAEEERRNAEASYRAAEQANQAKDEFLMILSHELRTPMTAILGWSRLLPTLSPTDPIVPQALASISRSADLQAQLIDDVLDVSRIVSGKLSLKLESVDVVNVLSAAIAAVRPSATAKNTVITTKFAGDVGTIIADPTRLQQIVWNLLANAVKFTPGGGAVEVSVRRSASHVQIAVKDNGQGIEPEFLPYIFEAFRQAETPQNRVHGGLGLGLSIVRHLTEAQGGTVRAESTGKGQGTTFSLEFPVGSPLRSVEGHRDTHGRHAEMVAGKLKGMTILIIDDDAETRALVNATLSRAGASVVIASSAPDAMAKLAERKPDLVITDIAMPNVNGFQIAKDVRAQPDAGGIKVIALSAFAAGEQTPPGLFDAYLNKPIDPFALVDSIASVMGR